jgi:hypothetical protein
MIICKGHSIPAREVHFGRMLERKVAELRYFEARARLVPLVSLPGESQPYWRHASAYVDFTDLMDAISDFTGISIPRPPEDRIKDALLATLARLVLDPRVGHKRMTNEELGGLLRQLRAQIAGLDLL